MTKLKIIFFSIIITLILSIFVCTAVNAKTGDAKRGKILFSNPKLAIVQQTILVTHVTITEMD